MRGFIGFIFGKKCEFCNKNGFRICLNCLSKISSLKKSQDGIDYFLSYQDEKIRKLIWKFKYKNEYSIAKDLAPLFSSYIFEIIDSNLDLQNKPIYIVPAPITKDPRKYRLQNHMLLFAKEVQKDLGKLGIKATVLDCMYKKTKIRSAMTLGKKKRVALINKSIVPKGSLPDTGVMFLIDDVTTTGATLNKMKSLVSKKQVVVQVLALAH